MTSNCYATRHLKRSKNADVLYGRPPTKDYWFVGKNPSLRLSKSQYVYLEQSFGDILLFKSTRDTKRFSPREHCRDPGWFSIPKRWKNICITWNVIKQGYKILMRYLGALHSTQCEISLQIFQYQKTCQMK